MAIRYVSNEASNGYYIGVNSGVGATKETCWLTVDYAYANASAGDTIIINDGLYYVATYLNITKNIAIIPENQHQTTLRSTTPNSTRLINFNASVAITCFLGAICIDANNASLYCVSSSADPILFNLTFDKTKFINPTQTFLNIASTKINLVCNDIIGSGAAITRSGVSAIALAEGSVNINGFQTTQVGNSVAGTGAVVLKATALGVTAAVRRVTGGISLNTSLTGVGNHLGIQIYNIANAIIDSPNLAIGNAPGERAAIHYWISADPTVGIDSSGGSILNPQGVNNTNGGILALIGQDSSNVSASDHNKSNNGVIYGGILIGSSNANAKLHGAMLGNSTGGMIAGNLIDNINIGTLAKGQTGGVVKHNIISRSTGQYLRSKGSSDIIFANNVCLGSEGFMAYGFLADEDSLAGVYSSGIEFKNNILLTSSIPTQKLAQCSVGSTATFTSNCYHSPAGLPDTPFTYQSTGYNSSDGWFAAVELGGIFNDPKFVSVLDYHLHKDSPCLGTGTKIPGINSDIEGNPLFPPYNIGPCGLSAGALGVAPVANDGPPRNNITRLTGESATIDPAGTYILDDTNGWRVVTGWTAGTANDFFDADGVPIPFTGQQLIDAGIGYQLYYGQKGVAGYVVEQDAKSHKKLVKFLRVNTYLDSVLYDPDQDYNW